MCSAFSLSLFLSQFPSSSCWEHAAIKGTTSKSIVRGNAAAILMQAPCPLSTAFAFPNDEPVQVPALGGIRACNSRRYYGRFLSNLLTYFSLSAAPLLPRAFLHPLASPPYFARHLLRVSLYFPLSLCFSLARKVS